MRYRLHHSCRQVLLIQTKQIFPARSLTSDTRSLTSDTRSLTSDTRSLTSDTRSQPHNGTSSFYCKHRGQEMSRFFATSACGSSSIVSTDRIIRSPSSDIVLPTDLSFHEYIFAKCDLYKDLPALVSVYYYSRFKF